MAVAGSRGNTPIPEQTKIAQKWNASDPWAIWNDTAAAVLRRHRVSEVEAARVLAVLNVAAMDAVVACFEAKYYYWTIRPSQADTTLVLADSVGLPNFPSYPSAHSCITGTAAGVLTGLFPSAQTMLDAKVVEAGVARIYAGLHFRFDITAGQAIGSKVAALALTHVPASNTAMPLQ